MSIKPSHIHYGTLPGRRDQGERFKVTYLDGRGIRCPFGFTDDREIAEHFVDKIKQNPMWSKPRLIDRKAKESAA